MRATGARAPSAPAATSTSVAPPSAPAATSAPHHPNTLAKSAPHRPAPAATRAPQHSSSQPPDSSRDSSLQLHGESLTTAMIVGAIPKHQYPSRTRTPSQPSKPAQGGFRSSQPPSRAPLRSVSPSLAPASTLAHPSLSTIQPRPHGLVGGMGSHDDADDNDDVFAVPMVAVTPRAVHATHAVDAKHAVGANGSKTARFGPVEEKTAHTVTPRLRDHAAGGPTAGGEHRSAALATGAAAGGAAGAGGGDSGVDGLLSATETISRLAGGRIKVKLPSAAVDQRGFGYKMIFDEDGM